MKNTQGPRRVPGEAEGGRGAPGVVNGAGRSRCPQGPRPQQVLTATSTATQLAGTATSAATRCPEVPLRPSSAAGTATSSASQLAGTATSAATRCP